MKKRVISILTVIFLLTSYGCAKVDNAEDKDKEEGLTDYTDMVLDVCGYEEGDNGWIYYACMNLTDTDISMPKEFASYYAYVYDGFNAKYVYRQNGSVPGYEIVEGLEPSQVSTATLIAGKDTANDIDAIRQYLNNNFFKKEITVENLADLELKVISKEQVVRLFNKGINSKWEEHGPLPVSGVASNIQEKAAGSLHSRAYDDKWIFSYMVYNGYVQYVNIDLRLVGGLFLSDLVDQGKATEEQTKIYELMLQYKNEILEKRTFDVTFDDVVGEYDFGLLLEMIQSQNNLIQGL